MSEVLINQIRMAQLAREIWGDKAALELCERFGLTPDVLEMKLPAEE